MTSKTGQVLLCLFFCLIMPVVSAVAGVSVTSGLTYERMAESGNAYQGAIQLQNTGEGPQEVKIYQTDYLFFCDGRNIYGDPGKDPRSNADWITFSPRRLIVPPRSKTMVNYTVQVPDDQGLTGTYWSMLMIEGISAASPEASGKKRDEINVGISQVMRYGLQMITQIGDTGTTQLKFVRTKVLKKDEKRILQIDMENIGEKWLRPDLWAELYNDKGISTGKLPGKKSRIYPGTSARFMIDLSRVPPGTYKALVVADCGGDDLFGTSYTLKFK